MSDTTNTTARPFTIASATALLSGERALSRDVLARAVATADTGDVTIALVAYAIRTRSIAGEVDGTASLGALAREMTADTPERVKSVRSTLSKRASVVGTILRARLDVPAHYRAAFLAYDSTADGRKILRDGVEKLHAATDMDDAARSVAFLALCEDARATKSAAAATRAARPNDGTDATASDADAAPAAPVRHTWAEALAILAAAAPAEAAALDVDTLDALAAHVEMIRDAIADARATADAARATHRNRRR